MWAIIENIKKYVQSSRISLLNCLYFDGAFLLCFDTTEMFSVDGRRCIQIFSYGVV